MTNHTETTPRIYVACLAAYNNGILHGRWIDADQGVDHIWNEVKAMLEASPIEEVAEEWAIHDYEGFEGIALSEWQSFETVAEYAELIEEHGPIIAELIAHFGGSVEDAETAINDCYHGEWDSITEYAEQFAEDCGYLAEVPEQLAYYIDFEAFGRDLMMGDFYSIEIDHKHHIFSHH